MPSDFSGFSGTLSYITSPELRHAVNVAAAIERPLLVRGEPGTGKTLLAEAIAEDLGLELISACILVRRWTPARGGKGTSYPRFRR